MSYWPTPPQVADDLVYRLLEPWHGLGEQVRVLEPSAGEGHLVRAVRARLPEAHITAVEPDPQRAATLRASGVADEVVCSTLEEYLAAVAVAARTGDWVPFDLVFMNPPFTLPGRPEAWADHVLAVVDDPHLLKAPISALGAVVPHIALGGKSKRVRQVRDRLGPVRCIDPAGPNGGFICRHGQIDPCERGAFGPVGAQVSTALLWMWNIHWDRHFDSGAQQTLW